MYVYIYIYIYICNSFTYFNKNIVMPTEREVVFIARTSF